MLGSRVDRQKALCQRKEKPRSLHEFRALRREAQGRPERSSAGLARGRKLPLSRTRWQLLLCGLAEPGN